MLPPHEEKDLLQIYLYHKGLREEKSECEEDR
jgi:hypothetical protein